MARVSNPILSLLATTLLLLGTNLSLQSARANEADSARADEADSARADTCIVSHSASAPKGQHWYFRTEKGRKCWYLHSGPPLVHHAAARPHSKAATHATSTAATHGEPTAHEVAAPATRPTNTQPAAAEVAWPAPAPTNTQQAAAEVGWPATLPTNTQPAEVEVAGPAPPPAEAAPPATAAVPGADAPPQPHIEILRTVPVGVPTQQAAQPSAPAAQAAPAAEVSNETSTGSADAVPSNTGSDVENAASAVRKAGRDAEPSASDAPQQKPAETAGLADTIATLQPTEMFFLLAIGLSIVVFLIAIASRIAAKRREPIITDYPDSAWSSDQFDPPQYDDTQFADEAMDEQWIDEEQDVSLVDPRALDDEQDWIEQRPSARTNRNKSSAASSAAPSEPDPKGLEPVLRLLRQA